MVFVSDGDDFVLQAKAGLLYWNEEYTHKEQLGLLKNNRFPPF